VSKNSELQQRSHLCHIPKPAQQKFGGKRWKFETVADMLYYMNFFFDVRPNMACKYNASELRS